MESGFILLEDLKDGTHVSFDTGGCKGTGTIRGIAFTAQPFIGRIYIVELHKRLEAYHYPCIAVPEVNLKVVEVVDA